MTTEREKRALALTTCDPRFDPKGRVTINGFAFAAERDWRTIESAPRDGFFMVWSPDHPEVPMPVRASLYHDAMARERKGGQPAHLSFGHFTHWRPLPAPPATPTAKEDGHGRG